MASARNSEGRFTSAPRPGTRVRVLSGSRAGALGVVAAGSATKRGYVRVVITDLADGTALPMDARGFGQYRTDAIETL